MTHKRLAKQQRPKEKYRFTKADCRRGYQAALAKCMEDWGLYAWFFHRIRGHSRRKEDQQ